MSAGICGLNDKQKSDLNQYSIYILPNDSDTDFDFYVLVDSEEAREKNEFLKKLHAYLTENNENNRNKLLNSLDENDPGLKILIEKYPYRLFVAIDKNDSDWKVNDKTPLDKDFLWNKYSEFIKKRICWIEKEELNKVFSEDNQNIIEEKESSYKLGWQERAKLWLYREWIKHLIINVTKVGVDNIIFKKMEGGSEFFKSVTLSPSFSSEQQSPSNVKANVNEKVVSCKVVENENCYSIAFARHEIPKGTYLHSEALSGSQFSYPLIMDFYNRHISNSITYNWCFLKYLIVESSLLRYLIIDERAFKYVNESQKKKFLSIGIEVSVDPPKQNNVHGLIIHQGIIDEKKEEFSEENFIGWKDKYPFFIITSGRGKPHNLTRLCKFLPFSILEFYLLKEYPEKILFNLAIMKLIK